METIDKAIEILQAFKEGKEVVNDKNLHITGPSSYIDNYEPYYKMIEKLASLQIVKEPTYRPYNDDEEFLKASREHGPYLYEMKAVYKADTSKKYKFSYFPTEVLIWGIVFADQHSKNWKEVYETFTWQNGTPCGIKEC